MAFVKDEHIHHVHVKIHLLNYTKISDETFYAQSQIMVENVPEFSAESLCLRQGVLTKIG